MKNNFFQKDLRLEARKLAQEILKKTNNAGRAYLEISVISEGIYIEKNSFWVNKRFKNNRLAITPIELLRKLNKLVKENYEAKEELTLFCNENIQNRVEASKTREGILGIKPKPIKYTPETIVEESNEDEEPAYQEETKAPPGNCNIF